MGSWKIVPREGTREQLVESLTGSRRRSVLLRGPSGVGKTTLAADVAATLTARGSTVVPIVALAELSAIPLGALAPLLSSTRLAHLDNSTDRLGALVAMIGAGATNYVLIVDDAPLLDDLSAAAVYQLVRVYGVAALLTVRDLHPIEGALARLLREDLVDVSDVDGLSIDETRSALSQRLGATINPATVQAVHTRTEGNPLFLRELVLAAERAGAIRDGSFGLELETAVLPPHILASVTEHVSDLSPGALELIRLLALSQPWPEDAIATEETNALDELIAAGVATRRTLGSAHTVALNHPLFAEAVAPISREVARSDRARAAQRLLQLDDKHYVFVATCLALEAAVQLSDEQLHTAAQYAHTIGDHATATRLARARSDAGSSCDTSLILAGAHSALGELDECSAAFARCRSSAVDDEQRALVASREGQHIAYRLGDPAAAIAHVTSVLDSLDAAGHALIAPDIAKWRVMVGDSTAVSEALASAENPLSTFSAALGQAMFATMSADIESARTALSVGRALAPSVGSAVPFSSNLLDLSEFLVLVAEGSIEAARQFAEECRARPPVDASGQWSYALAIVRGHDGDTAAAADLAGLAVQQLEWRDFTGLLGAAIALRSTLLAQLGELDQAKSALASLTPAHRADIKVRLQAAETEVWLARHSSDEDAAASALLAVAVDGLEFKHELLTTMSLALLTRAGRADLSAGPLRVAASSSSSPFIEALALQAESLRDSAVATSDALALRLAHLGMRATALDGLFLAERAARAAGNAPAALRIGAARATLVSSTRPVALQFQEERPNVLTDRELEIANSAARRERNREIADRLGVSIRTVENHLASIYRKLGVNGRDELAERLRSS
ncbi:MAG: LuxR C-terminal-related transcriptional regulator [Microbacteriaceae bacterium]